MPVSLSQALRSFLLVARHRWWIAPLVLSLTVGFIWAQESDLRTEPAYYAVSRSIEVADDLDALLVAGIQPKSVVLRPSERAQLGLLNGEDIKARVIAAVGGDAQVTVSQSEQQVQFLSAVVEEGGRDTFTFRFVPSNVFALSCTEEVRTYCEASIDVYIAELTQLRKSGITAGLEHLSALLRASQQSLPVSSSESQRLLSQIAVVDAAAIDPQVRVTVLSTTVTEEGATVVSVGGGSYLFGLVLGLVLVVLIWAQLTTVDRRIHDARLFQRKLPSVRLLGVLAQDAVSTRYFVATATSRARDLGKNTVRLLPLRGPAIEGLLASLSSETTGVHFGVSGPVAELPIAELIGNSDTADVVVVQLHRDRLDELEQTISVLENVGRSLAGVVLRN